MESGKVDISHYCQDQWRLMHIGAQPVPPSPDQGMETILPNHDYDTNYGLTETTGPGCVHLGMENQDFVGAIGGSWVLTGNVPLWMQQATSFPAVKVGSSS